MNGRVGMALTISATLCGVGQPVLAQDKPKAIVEAVVGRSGFIDETWDYFGTIGGGVRVFVTPRLAIGPEVAYLSGEFDARPEPHRHRQHDVRYRPRRWQTAGRAVSRSRRRLPPAEDACRRADRDPRRSCHSHRAKARCRPALAPASHSARICSSRPSSASDGNRKLASPSRSG